MGLREKFAGLAKNHAADQHQVELLWDEIEKNYSGSKRHYHNLSHLENLFSELESVHAKIQDPEAVAFAVFYHDLIYDVKKQDNEEKSADRAVECLNLLSVPASVMHACRALILATKSHAVSELADINLFTDADLSILGKPWKTYEIYYQQIRKEYSIYPDLLYKPGRIKVLKHFLAMPRIFKTEDFVSRYEEQARENLAGELAAIS
jgi:predicted metal-dependent HD superfamily phosphohydrolase